MAGSKHTHISYRFYRFLTTTAAFVMIALAISCAGTAGEQSRATAGIKNSGAGSPGSRTGTAGTTSADTGETTQTKAESPATDLLSATYTLKSVFFTATTVDSLPGLRVEAELRLRDGVSPPAGQTRSLYTMWFAAVENDTIVWKTSLPLHRTKLDQAENDGDTEPDPAALTIVSLEGAFPNLKGLSERREYRFVAALDENALNQTLEQQSVPDTLSQNLSVASATDVNLPLLGTSRLVAAAQLDLNGLLPVTPKEWRIVSVEDSTHSLNDSRAIKTGRFADPSSPVIALDTTDFRTAGTFCIFVLGTYANGLESSWIRIKNIAYSDTAPIALRSPMNDEVLLSSRVGFLVEESLPRKALIMKIGLKRNAAATAAPLEFERDIQLGSAGEVIDLKELFPGISRQDQVVYTLRYADTETAGSALFSGPQTLRYQPELDDVISVVQPGEHFDFQMGTDTGPVDEKPAHTVRLTRAFSAMRSPLSNIAAAELLNRLLRRGLARIENRTVIDSNGVVLAGLDRLDYGTQLGLALRENGTVFAPAERETHPATGISYPGALAMAAQAAELMGMPAGAVSLPTEAEWEFMATGGGTFPSPWGTKPDSQTVNFLRSGDAFEDPNPPYTRKVGPSVPNGYFDRVRVQRAAALSQTTRTLMFDRLKTMNMLGNVWEWTGNRYQANQYLSEAATDPAVDPAGPPSLSSAALAELTASGQQPRRSVRGASWNLPLSEVYSRNRGSFAETATSYSIGLRFIFLR